MEDIVLSLMHDTVWYFRAWKSRRTLAQWRVSQGGRLEGCVNRYLESLVSVVGLVHAVTMVLSAIYILDMKGKVCFPGVLFRFLFYLMSTQLLTPAADAYLSVIMCLTKQSAANPARYLLFML
jgi:hypothetical protein